MEVAIILFIIFAPTIIFLTLYFRQKKQRIRKKGNHPTRACFFT